MNKLRDLLNEFSGWVEAGALVVTALISLLPPQFLTYESTRYFSIVGGLAGIVGGGLWGLFLRRELKVEGWVGIVVGAFVSMVLGIVVLAVADGTLPNRFPSLKWAYNIYFAVPLLGDALFGFCYGMFCGCLASLIRFLPR